MDFSNSHRVDELSALVQSFMDEHVRPAERLYAEQLRAAGDAPFHPPVIDGITALARERGLWNFFLPHPELGAGLTTLEYAPLAELMGHSAIAPEAFNCNAPDTGNMEVLLEFGTDAQKERWLYPLLDARIRSCFAMTEPEVASSDARNIASEIVLDGDECIVNARKWFITGAGDDRCKVAIVMGVTDPAGATGKRHSMVLVPMDSPGISIVRDLPILGFHHGGGHCEMVLADVRVPRDHLLGAEGDGFRIAQARLGPGRIHHAMRAIGMAEKALAMLCSRATARTAFGKRVADQGVVQDWIAEARCMIDSARLLVLKTAWEIDTVGKERARTGISAIKVVAPRVATWVIDRAMQVHGAGGLSEDFPLADMYAWARALQIIDGPDEVHKMVIARQELQRSGRRGPR